MKKIIITFITILVQYISANIGFADTATDNEREVAKVEKAFAQTMADRDFETFKTFIADDAVFWSGEKALRGKNEITAAWKGYFDGDIAPFSWQPETVLALETENLALSTGPVRNREGVTYAYFTSVWKKNAAGKWQIIFDKGQNILLP